ncbi:MAG: PAS domain-containing protein [Myxococcales bacterium]|nr:PAS domain-containing protein [Myxococcales bacterium]
MQTLDLDVSLPEALDALSEGLQVLSPDFRYLYLNAAAARQGRKTREEVLGRSMVECYPGIGETAMFAWLERCMRDRTAGTQENEFVHENGERAWFELRACPCPRGLAVVSIDITTRKGEEIELQESYRQALRDLVTPVIRVHPAVLLVPLIGAVDETRAGLMIENVLERVTAEAARVVIFDVAGVPALDSAVANHLIQATAMIKLLGASTVLTGVSPAAAKAMVNLGVDLSSMETKSHLAAGLDVALAKVGRAVTTSRC